MTVELFFVAPFLSFGHPFPARGKELITFERERGGNKDFFKIFPKDFLLISERGTSETKKLFLPIF